MQFPGENVPEGVDLQRKQKQSLIYGHPDAAISGYVLGKFFFYNMLPISAPFRLIRKQSYYDEQCRRQEAVKEMRRNSDAATRSTLDKIEAPNFARGLTEILVRGSGFLTPSLLRIAFVGFAAFLEGKAQETKKSDVDTVKTIQAAPANDTSLHRRMSADSTYVLKP